MVHNNITAFPKNFARFTNITSLWLDWNQITTETTPWATLIGLIDNIILIPK